MNIPRDEDVLAADGECLESNGVRLTMKMKGIGRLHA